MPNTENNNSKYIEELIKSGSDIAGNAIGASIGFVISGPDGAIIGGASGPLLKFTFLHLASEIKNRLIGEREKVRIGATIAFAVEKIQNNLEKGMEIRQDNFFEKNIGERTAADEILEGILLAAQREYQEKKIQFYGNLIANIAFHPEIDKEQANFLIKLGENLSYRQICLLSLFQNKEEFNLKENYYRDSGEINIKTGILLQEIYDLYSNGILSSSHSALLGIRDIYPSKMNVIGAGAWLYTLMELWEINIHDLNQIANLLK